MPITWNQATSKWDVKDKSGQVKWSANKYVDAVTFTEDYNN